MRNTVFKILLLLGALVGIAMGVSLMFPEKPSAAPRPLPNPNGYDIFVKAGRTVMGGINLQRMTRDELALVVESNSNALQLARTGFQFECRVPVQFSTSYFSNHSMREIVPLRSLGQLFAAEGRLAEFEDRMSNAADCYLDTIHLGHAISHGGTLIDAMIGAATQSLGTSYLRPLANRLDSETSRQAARRLEMLDAEADSWQQVIAREKEAVANYPGNLKYKISTYFRSRNPATFSKAEVRFTEQQLEGRKLLIQLAARAYELENGTTPTTAADLVPVYLKEVPKDPGTGTNLTLSR
jgi:hypothetical protein